jgi:hypothetical protein
VLLKYKMFNKPTSRARATKQRQKDREVGTRDAEKERGQSYRQSRSRGILKNPRKIKWGRDREAETFTEVEREKWIDRYLNR